MSFNGKWDDYLRSFDGLEESKRGWIASCIDALQRYLPESQRAVVFTFVVAVIGIAVLGSYREQLLGITVALLWAATLGAVLWLNRDGKEQTGQTPESGNATGGGKEVGRPPDP